MSDQMQPSQLIKRKKRSPIIILFIIIVIIIICALTIYFLLPGLSKPINLGVEASVRTYNISMEKLNAAENSVEGDTENKTVNVSLTSEEFTSLIAENPSTYNNMKNFQARVNPDNTMEASATICTSFILNDVLKGKYSKEDFKEALPLLETIPEDINFYCKISQESVNNNITDFQLQDINVMGISVPDNLTASQEAAVLMENILDEILEDISGTSSIKFDDIQITGGKLELKGQVHQ